MSALAQLPILDMTGQLDAIPRMRGHQALPPRGREQYITFHFSDVIYPDRSRSTELVSLFGEARYQIRKDWSRNQRGIYGDGLMYDFVVLSDGTIVRSRRQRQRQALWHCNNVLGNSRSWSVHVMLGRGQDLTSPQRTATFGLFDALRADGDISRQDVVAHCEWPVGNGAPVPAARYRVQPGQSLCPMPVLFSHVAAYRALTSAVPTAELPPAGPYRVLRSKWIYQQPQAILRAHAGDHEYFVLDRGDAVQIDPFVIGLDGAVWGKLADNRGFVKYAPSDLRKAA
jgi:hypothetical protein